MGNPQGSTETVKNGAGIPFTSEAKGGEKGRKKSTKGQRGEEGATTDEKREDNHASDLAAQREPLLSEGNELSLRGGGVQKKHKKRSNPSNTQKARCGTQANRFAGPQYKTVEQWKGGGKIFGGVASGGEIKKAQIYKMRLQNNSRKERNAGTLGKGGAWKGQEKHQEGQIYKS